MEATPAHTLSPKRRPQFQVLEASSVGGGKKGAGYWRMKWSDEINLVISEGELSNWHRRTLARMPSAILMRYRGRLTLMPPNSPQLPAPRVRVSLTFDWFYSMTSRGDIHIPLRLSANRWGPRDWRGFRNLNFYKSYMPFSLKVNPFVCGRWRPVLGMEGGEEGWSEVWIWIWRKNCS